MKPLRSMGYPVHPWMKVALPVAALAIGGAAAYGMYRATDDERSTADRIVSGVVGAGAAVGAIAIGARLTKASYAIKSAAEEAVRNGGSYATYPWPAGTAKATLGNGTWHIPAQEGIGDPLYVGGYLGGFFGAGIGGMTGYAIHSTDD